MLTGVIIRDSNLSLRPLIRYNVCKNVMFAFSDAIFYPVSFP